MCITYDIDIDQGIYWVKLNDRELCHDFAAVASAGLFFSVGVLWEQKRSVSLQVQGSYRGLASTRSALQLSDIAHLISGGACVSGSP